MGNKKKKSGEQLLLSRDAADDDFVIAVPEVVTDQGAAHPNADSVDVPDVRQRRKDKRKGNATPLTISSGGRSEGTVAAAAGLSTKKRRRDESAAEDHAATDDSASDKHNVVKSAKVLKERKHNKSAGDHSVEADGDDVEPEDNRDSNAAPAKRKSKKSRNGTASVQQNSSATTAKSSRELPAVDESSTVAEQTPSKKAKKHKKKKPTKNGSSKTEGHAAAEAGTPKCSARDAALAYLDAWKNDKDNWSFQKVRQVWLLQHMYSVTEVDDDRFAILLEYLEPLKGKARAETVRKAEEMLAKADVDDGAAEADGGSAAPAVNELVLLRAKEIVQQLSTD